MISNDPLKLMSSIATLYYKQIQCKDKGYFLCCYIMSIAMDWNDQLICNAYTKSSKDFVNQNEKSSEGNWKN